MGLRTSAIPFAKKVIRAAVYGRHSSKNQNPTSAAEQIDLIQVLAKKESLALVKYPQNLFDIQIFPHLIFKDEAMAGRTTVGRHGYDGFIKGIENGDFEVGLVDDLSRLCRDLGDQIHLYDLAQYKKVEIFSVGEGISSAATNSRLHFIFKGMVNEIGNDTHAKQTKRGLMARVNSGFSAGDICLGYDSKPTRTRMRGNLEIPSHFEIVINEEQAKTVRTIFQLRLRGMGYAAISKYLNSNQIPSPPRSQKISGKKCNWSSSVVRKILTNRKYIGYWVWGKKTTIKNPMTKRLEQKDQDKSQWIEHFGGDKIREDLIIIDMETWGKIQKTIKPVAKNYKPKEDKWAHARSYVTSGSRSETLLAGILICAECGGNMLQVSTTNKTGYLGCYLYHRNDRNLCTNNRLMGRQKIERIIAEQLKIILLDDHNVNLAVKIVNQKIKERMSSVPTEIRSMIKERHTLEKEIKNFMRFIKEQGELSLTAASELRVAEERQQFIIERLKALETVNNDKLMLTPFVIKDRFMRLIELFERDPKLANVALRKLIPDKLKCFSLAEKTSKNGNQYTTRWRVEGAIVIDSTADVANTALNLKIEI